MRHSESKELEKTLKNGILTLVVLSFLSSATLILSVLLC
jgi:hypothetical protein